ncbi:MAG TPA: serine/threonine-protein kinase [Gemmataceae bacterium]|nr:serine/threonine-protein kinase [Gemmataceae bacterium]
MPSQSSPASTPAAKSNSPELATITYVGEQPATVHAGPACKSFGDYELVEEVARGGMGVVYRARQNSLNRIVALKMILPGRLANAEELIRFRTEAEATARLQHPNIVTIYEVGAVDGQHFYSMDFIDGPSLSKKLAYGPLPGRLAARYVMTVARAMHHAHCHGILHRDLKPSNILLDAEDVPHITDFGLAKKIDADSSQTRTGMVMGTPSYMAPEQAAGKIKELGPPCDIYSLGALLYELITGRPPFKSDTPLDTLMHVMERDPAPPRLLNPKVDRDLETICLKCLEKDPRGRYATAEALADDLEHYLNGEAINARSFSMIDRLARTLDRSQYAFEFHSWGTMLLWFGVIVFLGHFITFVLLKSHLPEKSHWIARIAEFICMGIVFWYVRGSRTLLPTSSAERQLWSIWIGYMMAMVMITLVSRLMVSKDRLWDDRALYPFSAILTGMAFFVMGSNYWGQCYAIGLVFFGLAALMTFNLDLAPLEFGGLWGITFLLIGLHVRRMGAQDRGETSVELTVQQNFLEPSSNKGIIE